MNYIINIYFSRLSDQKEKILKWLKDCQPIQPAQFQGQVGLIIYSSMSLNVRSLKSSIFDSQRYP